MDRIQAAGSAHLAGGTRWLRSIVLHEYEEISKARKSFELHRVRDKELDGVSVETLRGCYTEVRKDKDTPAGMDYGTFLFASPEAVESLLSLEEDNLLNVKTAFWCDDAPSLLVVMDAVEVHTHGDKEDEYDPNDPNDGGNRYKSVFKVPVEIIVDSPWDLFDVAFIPPSRLTK